MLPKKQLKEHVCTFPEAKISPDALIERLIFIEKLEERFTLSEKGGATISAQAMEKEMQQWRNTIRKTRTCI